MNQMHYSVFWTFQAFFKFLFYCQIFASFKINCLKLEKLSARKRDTNTTVICVQGMREQNLAVLSGWERLFSPVSQSITLVNRVHL